MNDIVEEAKRVRASLVHLAQFAPDQEAVRNQEGYDFWESYHNYHINDKVRYNNQLYKCRLGHTSQNDWAPSNTPAMWTIIELVHLGTQDDPIPAKKGMQYEVDKYYIEDAILFLCIRSTEQPVAYLPSELVGVYMRRIS